MRKPLAYSALAASLAIAALPLMSRAAAMEQEKMEKEVKVMVRLAPLNNSGESGSAVLKAVEGKTLVTLTLTGAPVDVAQPAHIHAGSCPTPDDVKYPLTSVANGASETTLDVSFQDLMKQLPLAVNVHKSAEEAGVYVACGNVRKSAEMLKEEQAAKAKMRRAANDKYLAALKEARTVYLAALKTAREAYQKAIKDAQKAYAEARAKAKTAYDADKAAIK